MEMEIARLTNIFWVRIPDRGVVARRTVWPRPDRSWTGSGMPPAKAPLPVPSLDWPPALFQDAVRSH
jgi:hypothetical protein